MTWQQIEAGEQLIQAEKGTVYKDWGGRLPIALIFPNSYYLGMSSLALHTLYRLWNASDDIVCERVFVDPSAGDPAPPLSLESGAPVDYFPVLAFSLTYEMDYFNLVGLLRAAGLPLRARERDESHPLIIAGGPAVSANPEPLAPFLDAVLIGEIEPAFAALTAALRCIYDGREAALEALSQVAGVYLPNPDETPAPGRPVVRQWLADLDRCPTHSTILTPNTEFSNMGLIEIARGCGRGCRFCLAGYAYRPPRERSVACIIEQARVLLADTDRIGLVSAAVSDHSGIDVLARQLRQLGADISVSSMRVDPPSTPLIRALAESGTRTLTIAPEAGSERLRQAINKTQTADDVLRAVDLAAHYGLAQVKLYFMIGLPTETEEDIQALVDLTLACAQRFTGRVTANVTPFVPKAGTPFQRVAQTRAKTLKKRLDYVDSKLRRQAITVKSESPAWAEIQGGLARGDRRVAEALLTVERVTPGNWKKALNEAGLSLQDLLRERAAGEPLPWDFIRSGIQEAHLRREAQRAAVPRTTGPCQPADCVACGVCQ
ncbi:MAG: radical SAM protein [Anaerolineae bacterium]|nr:radical SAM protein [Anaerolineae bacterium]